LKMQAMDLWVPYTSKYDFKLSGPCPNVRVPLRG
jgi:hypothetical protein